MVTQSVLANLVHSRPNTNSERVYRALCQILAGKPEAVDWRAFDPSHWGLLEDMAKDEGVAPLVYWIFKERGLSAQLPDSVRNGLAQAYYSTAAQNQLLYQELARILKAFDQAGVPAIVLKGAALAGSLYPDIALRPMGDLDLLLHPAHLEKAEQTVRSLGYHIEQYPEMAPGLNRVVGCHVIYREKANQNIVVELHWSLLNWHRSLSLDWFWEQTENQKMENDGQMAVTLLPTAHLLYLAGHLFFHHHSQQRLIWYYDIHLFVTRTDGDLFWESLLEKARQLRWSEELHTALLGTQSRFGTTLPKNYLDLLGIDSGRGAPGIPRPKTWPEKRVGKAWSALSSMEWQERFRLILRGLFPSPSYLAFTYAPRRAWLWPLYYPLHWMGILIDGFKVLRSTTFKRMTNRHKNGL